MSISTISSTLPAVRFRWLLLLVLVSLWFFRIPLSHLFGLALRNDHYQHILVVPLITLAFLWLDWAKISADSRYEPAVGVPLLSLGILLALMAEGIPVTEGQEITQSIGIFAILLTWTGLFVLCFGKRALKTALFPMLFLLLMIPIPQAALDRFVLALQWGSAEAAYLVFRLIHTPVVRDGFIFALPGLKIEIAKQCSGINSTSALFLTGILAGHLFLRANWSRVCLVLLAVPIAIFNNAVRIVTISWLSIHVDRGFLYGNLHRNGGLVFSLLAVTLMALAVVGLRRLDTSSENSEKLLAPSLEPAPAPHT